MNIKRIARWARLCCGTAVMALAAGVVHSEPVSITTEGLSITVGDKTFDNFTCTIAGDFGFNGPAACSGITVVGLETDPFGIRFQSSFFVLGEGSLDVLIGYDVTVNDPSQAISDIFLGFNGSFLGMAITSITETAYADALLTNEVGQALVYNGFGIGAQLTDTVDLAGTYQFLSVTKDILLAADDTEPSSAAFISQIDQRFHQIPEPGSLGLIGIALVGAAAARRRRSE